MNDSPTPLSFSVILILLKVLTDTNENPRTKERYLRLFGKDNQLKPDHLNESSNRLWRTDDKYGILKSKERKLLSKRSECTQKSNPLFIPLETSFCLPLIPECLWSEVLSLTLSVLPILWLLSNTSN